MKKTEASFLSRITTLFSSNDDDNNGKRKLNEEEIEDELFWECLTLLSEMSKEGTLKQAKKEIEELDEKLSLEKEKQDEHVFEKAFELAKKHNITLKSNTVINEDEEKDEVHKLEKNISKLENKVIDINDDLLSKKHKGTERPVNVTSL